MATPEARLKNISKKTRRVLRLIGWNLLLTLAGLALIALTGEVYLRLKRSMMPFSFATNSTPWHFVPKVGMILKPNVEVSWTNFNDFWTISRTNSLGFLDREPISPERAAASCHITMIGDSFVVAREVPIADKFHVRLEKLATQELPHLDLTTSAFGLGGTGQISQLPYYDEFARHLSPKLVVLVFVSNDFRDNSPILIPWEQSVHPDRQPYVTAARDQNGTMKLRPPNPDWQTLGWHIFSGLSWSYFVQGVINNISSNRANFIQHQFDKKKLLPAFEKELAFTAFALDQFEERTERDGASLVILATHTMRLRGRAVFDHMSALAEARNIPVIDQYDYIRHQGADPERDARWAEDVHWNEQGHQWAAEALLKYLKENPEICTRPADTGTP